MSEFIIIQNRLFITSDVIDLFKKYLNKTITINTKERIIKWPRLEDFCTVFRDVYCNCREVPIDFDLGCVRIDDKFYLPSEYKNVTCVDDNLSNIMKLTEELKSKVMHFYDNNLCLLFMDYDSSGNGRYYYICDNKHIAHIKNTVDIIQKIYTNDVVINDKLNTYCFNVYHIESPMFGRTGFYCMCGNHVYSCFDGELYVKFQSENIILDEVKYDSFINKGMHRLMVSLRENAVIHVQQMECFKDPKFLMFLYEINQLQFYIKENYVRIEYGIAPIDS